MVEAVRKLEVMYVMFPVVAHRTLLPIGSWGDSLHLDLLATRQGLHTFGDSRHGLLQWI
jgi:hypothetical protein